MTDQTTMRAVRCPRCASPLKADDNPGAQTRCPRCGDLLTLEVFPALYQEQGRVETGEAVTSGEEASCFYHPRKKAANICSVCGRFLCSLCNVELGGKSLCPACIHGGRENGRVDLLVTDRTLHDGIALSVAIVPIILFWVTIFTAPIALFLGIRSWNRTKTLLPRTRVRSVLAIIIASVQIIGWLYVLAKILESD